MEKPKWVDEAIAKAAEEVRTALEEDSIRTPISQLSTCFCVKRAKPEDKKQGPVEVVELSDYIKLGITTRKLVSRVNYLSKMMLKLMGKEEPKKELPDRETIDTIMAWQRETFPQNTYVGQLVKWDEECAEFKEAVKTGDMEQYVSELADMFIVACGIMLFNTEMGCLKLLYCVELRKEHNVLATYFQRALNRKMIKNRRRVWEYKDGNYHHVKGVED